MEAITREEKLLSGQQLEPITRKELFLAKAAGMDVQTPEPITREEMFLSQISGGGGGTIEPLSVTANGTYNPPDGVDGYSPVTVSVARDDQTDMVDQWIRAIERDSSKPLTELPAGLTKIGDYAFYGNYFMSIRTIPSGATSIGYYAFSACTGLTEITFYGKPTSINSSAFYNCKNLLTINVPWAEGEVSGAPWGATNATINYNYTGG